PVKAAPFSRTIPRIEALVVGSALALPAASIAARQTATQTHGFCRIIGASSGRTRRPRLPRAPAPQSILAGLRGFWRHGARNRALALGGDRLVGPFRGRFVRLLGSRAIDSGDA